MKPLFPYEIQQLIDELPYSAFHNYHPPLGFGGGMGKACPAYTGGGWDFYDKQ